MLSLDEKQMVDAVVNFIKNNEYFRPINLEEKQELLEAAVREDTFLLVRGSFKARDVFLGIKMHYDITSPHRGKADLTYFYRVPANLSFTASFTQEGAEEKASKLVGPNPEVEVDIKPIDDQFLIHSNDLPILKKSLEKGVFRSFLMDVRTVLVRLYICQQYIEFQRLVPEKEDFTIVEKDLENLLWLADFLEKIV